MGNIIHLQHCDPFSILIINRTGRLRRLYTPFKVLCLTDIGNIKATMGVYIDEVATNDRDELVYLIAGTAYNHNNFRILAVF